MGLQAGRPLTFGTLFKQTDCLDRVLNDFSTILDNEFYQYPTYIGADRFGAERHFSSDFGNGFPPRRYGT